MTIQKISFKLLLHTELTIIRYNVIRVRNPVVSMINENFQARTRFRFNFSSPLINQRHWTHN
jgi:hypothetical protein